MINCDECWALVIYIYIWHDICWLLCNQWLIDNFLIKTSIYIRSMLCSSVVKNINVGNFLDVHRRSAKIWNGSTRMNAKSTFLTPHPHPHPTSRLKKLTYIKRHIQEYLLPLTFDLVFRAIFLAPFHKSIKYLNWIKRGFS